MNFKYAMMACAAVATMGLASCSDNDDNGEEVLEGKKAYIHIGLVQNGPQTRALNIIEPTADEKVIKNGTVYVFNSNKVLVDYIELATDYDKKDAADQITYETTAGMHYFLAAANTPVVTIDKGTHLDEVKSILNSINTGVFDEYINKTTPNKGFFMTSGVFMENDNYSRIEYASLDVQEAVTEADVVADFDTQKVNFVQLNIGRAMAKVDAKLTLGGDDLVPHDQAAGELRDVKYVVTNNPTAMYFMPYFGGKNLFQTPYFDLYDTTKEPENYWPALHSDAADLPYVAAGADNTRATMYALENSNKVATYGNSTIVSVQGTFVPKEIDGTAHDGTVTDFWRNLNEDGTYAPEFYSTEALAKTGDLTTKATQIEYKDGLCYYIIPLGNDKKTNPECYDVVRNHYYLVNIHEVFECGYSKPGGDGYTEPKEELDPEDVYMHASINVLGWYEVGVDGGLQPR